MSDDYLGSEGTHEEVSEVGGSGSWVTDEGDATTDVLDEVRMSTAADQRNINAAGFWVVV